MTRPRGVAAFGGPQPGLQEQLREVAESMRLQGRSRAEVDAALVGANRRWLLRRELVRVVPVTACLVIVDLVISGTTLLVLLLEAVPKVGFWKALSPVVLFSDALDRPCDVPLRVWTIVLAALHGYGANAICTPCLSLHQLLARLFCCWWQFEASRTLSVRTPRGVVQIRHVPRPKRVVYFDIALLTIYVVWCLLGFAWVRMARLPEGSSDKTPGAPCSSTAPELFYSSALTVTGLLGLVVSWLLCNVGALAVRRGLVQSGFNVFQASPGDALERQTAVPYDPAVFEAEDAPLECHICLEEFGASREIRRTMCGHYFHHECLGRWFETALACPVCRRDLSGVPVPRVDQPATDALGRPAEDAGSSGAEDAAGGAGP